jgi:hypothetical protein
MNAYLNKNVFLKNMLFLIAILALGNISVAQDSKADESANVQSMVDAQRFVFKAQSAHPNRGRTVQLNSNYELAVSGDTVRSYLPYFGRAYSAPMDGRGGGIDFLSKNFQYNKKQRKKGGWEISIKPEDVTDVREVLLTVFDNGSASLRVNSNNRETISYNGYLAQK